MLGMGRLFLIMNSINLLSGEHYKIIHHFSEYLIQF